MPTGCAWSAAFTSVSARPPLDRNQGNSASIASSTDHVAVHTEVLVHVGAYAELVLDYGWSQDCLAFDPFTRGAALDLWGFKKPVAPGESWWDGTITFVAEAKARVAGPDSLNGLAMAFERLQGDSNVTVHPGHRRKWEGLVTIVGHHGPVELLRVADSARWWYDVTPIARTSAAIRLERKTLMHSSLFRRVVRAIGTDQAPRP
jgi:hypothetical protein